MMFNKLVERIVSDIGTNDDNLDPGINNYLVCAVQNDLVLLPYEYIAADNVYDVKKKMIEMYCSENDLPNDLDLHAIIKTEGDVLYINPKTSDIVVFAVPSNHYMYSVCNGRTLNSDTKFKSSREKIQKYTELHRVDKFILALRKGNKTNDYVYQEVYDRYNLSLPGVMNKAKRAALPEDIISLLYRVGISQMMIDKIEYYYSCFGIFITDDINDKEGILKIGENIKSMSKHDADVYINNILLPKLP